MSDKRSPHLDRCFRETGVSVERLVAAFEIEQEFHRAILAETDPVARRAMYRQVYNTVHAIYDKSPQSARAGDSNPKDYLVRLFRRTCPINAWWE